MNLTGMEIVCIFADFTEQEVCIPPVSLFACRGKFTNQKISNETKTAFLATETNKVLDYDSYRFFSNRDK